MNDLIRSYLGLTFDLAKSIVIKSDITATRINEYLELFHKEIVIDKSRPATWKYYLNLSGEYHAIDTPMTIISLDTQEVIDFNKTTLSVHKVTYKEYSSGGTYYQQLITRYPGQESLILGILSPTDINKAIEAVDGSIVNYNKLLVEPQEDKFIIELEEWCIQHQRRWDVQGYYFTDELYPAAQLAILHLNILPKILNIRSRNAHTPQAHSFHMRMFLGGHKYLDKFIPSLSLGEVSWLYRNIRHIERNLGETGTLKYVIDNMFTPNKIPLSHLRIKQTDVELNNYLDHTLRATMLTANAISEDYDTETIIALTGLTPESVKGSNYDTFIESAVSDIKKDLSYTTTDDLSTKTMQSDLLDTGDGNRRTLETIVLEYWAYTIHTGIYTASVLYNDPTGREPVLMDGRDAWLTFIYLLFRWIGITPDKIPNWYYHSVELTAVQDEVLYRDVHPTFSGLKQLAVIRDNIPTSISVATVDEFSNNSIRAYKRVLSEWIMTGSIGDVMDKAIVIDALRRTRTSGEFTVPETGTDYTEYLREMGFSYMEEVTYDHLSGMTAMLKAATGFDFNDKFLMPVVQEHLISLLGKLKSYTTQIISTSTTQLAMILDRRVVSSKIDALGISLDSIYPLNVTVHAIETDIEDTLSFTRDVDVNYDISYTEMYILGTKVQTTTHTDMTEVYDVPLLHGGIVSDYTDNIPPSPPVVDIYSTTIP